ncbi:MAG: hypothetical protein Q4C91_01380 [Eubacteriales bacterium]|nr:hypothetical protein [Eubacteriales bacterium]
MSEICKPEDGVIKFSPYVNNTVPQNCVFVSPEGAWMPMPEDGKWMVTPFAYDFWWKENEKWYDGVTIHAGLNPFSRYDVEGSEFIPFLEAVSVNTFRKFPIGKARHTILCQPNGKIMLDGIVLRRDEDKFHALCWLDPQMINGTVGNKFHFKSEYTGTKRFFYQLCGDKSLEVIEKACHEDMHDVKFMWAKDAKIAGHDVYILRTGMSGTLAYEVHGMMEDALDVYNELLRVGEEYGIQQLGRFGYINQHCEGSIPQVAEHFHTCIPGFYTPMTFGSLPRGHELEYRSPFDCGWGNLVKFNHDFTGKEALEKEAAGPHRDAVHLIWNKEDVAKITLASLDPELRVDPIDMCCDYDFVRNCNSVHIDAVYAGDKMIGASSGRMTSAKTREMISFASLDTEYCTDGKEVEVLWGNPGTTQMRVRATVKKFPYFTEKRNNNFDLETIPHYKPE